MNKTDNINKDTSRANFQRVNNADEFALEIVRKLNEIENINNYKFKGLSDRATALNHMKIKTTRGCMWSNNSVKRVLKRAEDLNYK